VYSCGKCGGGQARKAASMRPHILCRRAGRMDGRWGPMRGYAAVPGNHTTQKRANVTAGEKLTHLPK